METKIMFALYALAFASGAQCAKIIPLSYWQQSGDGAATISSADREQASNSRYYVGRFDQSMPEYYSYSTRAKEAAERRDNDETIMAYGSDFEGRSQNAEEAIAPATPSETEMELYGHERDARKMRQNPTTMKPRKKNKESLMSRILPMLVMPFLVSSSLIPMMLTTLKFMLLKSLFVGKIAIVLLAINALWKSDNRGGVYSHNVSYDHGHEQKDLHQNHYGYNGDEEYGAYVNRRSARVTRFR